MATRRSGFMKRYGIFFCWLLLAVTGCRKQEPIAHPIQFYHWKANAAIGEVEQAYFKQLNCRKLYIRFFDVDKQGRDIVPLAKVRAFDPDVLDAVYIPVIFITNRTFSGISDEQLTDLVKKVLELADAIRLANRLPESAEIQIDCDWTESTRQAYFRFLELLKQQSGMSVSCTLRLHQIKFSRQTGIPPVDKGYLMCYATSDPTENTGQNSILDMALLKEYTVSINDYPLDFDIALPIYSWGIVTNHLGRVKLINNVVASELDTTVFRPIGEELFELQQDYFFKGFYVNKGFTLKVERISPGLLQDAKLYLDKKIQRPYDIVYYHLDAPFLTSYKISDLQ